MMTLTWLDIHDMYTSILAVLAALLCVSEGWAWRIQKRRLVGMSDTDPLHRQVVSFLADFHLGLATVSGLLSALCIVLIVVPDDGHARYVLWSAWVAAWLLFSARRWRWLFVGSRMWN